MNNGIRVTDILKPAENRRGAGCSSACCCGASTDLMCFSRTQQDKKKGTLVLDKPTCGMSWL